MKTLKDELKDWLVPEDHGYDNEKQQLEDLLQHGCVSGMVGSLIYYGDTVKFYEDHKEEINGLLAEMCIDTGLSPAELFGDKWDNEDPLAQDTYNKNLLAWFGFEETAYRYANEKEYQI
jgi:hypothetical protein